MVSVISHPNVGHSLIWMPLRLKTPDGPVGSSRHSLASMNTGIIQLEPVTNTHISPSDRDHSHCANKSVKRADAKMFPREKWLMMPLSHFEKDHLTEEGTEERRERRMGIYNFMLHCLHNGRFHLALMMKSSVALRYAAHWKDDEERRLIVNQAANQGWLDLRTLSPLPRPGKRTDPLMHPWVQK